ncbi:MAG: hypothetical protein HZA54_16985 [Planctomycetes bacterium]|nr:hypothetical protein [Planctomycetota bacterium]
MSLRRLAALFLLLPFLAAAFAASGSAPLGAEEGPVCDLAKVEAGFWCGGCKAVLAPDGRDASGKCRTCKDGGKVEEAEVCVKTVYVCDKCKDASLAPGACDDCKVERTAHRVAARVVWACPACHAPGAGPGACGGADCKGAARVRACSESGRFPHVAASGK